MSRITIDLKKRAREPVVHGDPQTDPTGDGAPHRYQLSHIRYRDPCEFTWRQNPDDPETATDPGTIPGTPTRPVAAARSPETGEEPWRRLGVPVYTRP